MLSPQQDPLGRAVKDYYYNGVDSAEIIVHTDIADDDIIPVKLLFRTFDEMPKLEQHALEQCYGKVLDVGSGAGCHTLALQERGMDVSAIDISPGAVEIMKEQGIKQVRNMEFFDVEGETYDTLLLMMNGVGLVANLAGFKRFLVHADSLLAPQGQILFDTSDIEYLYMEEGARMIDLERGYYGEVTYQMEYKDTKGPRFGWLYLDFITLTDLAMEHGFNVQLLYDDDRFNYLVRLTRMDE